MKKIILATFLVATGLLGAAHAEEGQDCTQKAKDQWLSENAIKDKAKAAGIEVRRVKVEGSCYEVYGIDAKGNKVETLFDPVTGTAVNNESD